MSFYDSSDPEGQMPEKIIIGYRAASELTGIPIKTLRTMAARKSIRIVRISKTIVGFYPSKLLEDISKLEIATF